MAHLTKEIRERICNKATKATFEPKRDAMLKREQKLAIECYNHVFPKNIRDIIAKVPEGWLRTCNCLRFNANGWEVSLNAGKEMSTPNINTCSRLGNLTGDLAKKVQDFSQEKKTMNDDWRQANVKMLGFLEQFRTFKTLEEAWPEGKKFYKEFDAERTAKNLPAVITKEINEMLGIAT